MGVASWSRLDAECYSGKGKRYRFEAVISPAAEEEPVDSWRGSSLHVRALEAGACTNKARVLRRGSSSPVTVDSRQQLQALAEELEVKGTQANASEPNAVPSAEMAAAAPKETRPCDNDAGLRGLCGRTADVGQACHFKHIAMQETVASWVILIPPFWNLLSRLNRHQLLEPRSLTAAADATWRVEVGGWTYAVITAALYRRIRGWWRKTAIPLAIC
ncbi:unnamed protein product, partial [Effrenium voratum]